MIGGKEIIKQVELGNIIIEPFNTKQAGPNSYDLRLAPQLARVVPNSFIGPEFANTKVIDTRIGGSIVYERQLDSGAFLLQPDCLYLGLTIEKVGSKYYVPLLHGRSSAARHGLMVHLTAGFGDAGWVGNYVLEIKNMTPYPMLVYPGDRICQVEWERVEGEYELYQSTYQNQDRIIPGKGLQDGN